ncbi:SapC family protein [Alteromonas gilva]|uniref:SapC family protein n=1 Tax=Alteromonas gilva TaxID=2987522 RepID=A0ABT5L7W5_9ALTE|nr:SapC family protein [Alteromonas gilva]MDC8832476.1 SapC family protein [Alteromonas gilva]
MTKHVMLNNVYHKDTKVIARYAKEYGDNQASVLAFPSEFVELQKHYPIFLRRDHNTEDYHCTVLLGLEKDENLFLDASHPSGWNADYVPAILSKGPFLIGFQQQQDSEEKTAVIHIDMDHPKVNDEKGQSLFLTHGGNSPYLEHVSTCLQLIDNGINLQGNMLKRFAQLDLIEPVNIEFELSNGEQRALSGNYAIHEEKLAALSAEDLYSLNKAGYLQLAFAMVASMTNVRKLINLKNLQLAR